MAASHRPPTSLHGAWRACVAHACVYGQAGSPATGYVEQIVGASAGAVEVRLHSHRGATPRFRTAQGDLGQLNLYGECMVRVNVWSACHPRGLAMRGMSERAAP